MVTSLAWNQQIEDIKQIVHSFTFLAVISNLLVLLSPLLQYVISFSGSQRDVCAKPVSKIFLLKSS